jgi:hypothetical protein
MGQPEKEKENHIGCLSVQYHAIPPISKSNEWLLNPKETVPKGEAATITPNCIHCVLIEIFL